jgi:endonuclease/exonuclease/phosphatase family metal-dependent hydrolase
MARLRLVSYNIHKGRSLGGRDSLGELRLGLHGLHPDILFLQEVQGRNEQRMNLHAQHESLGAALRMEVAYGCNAVHDLTDHGNALLSRFPIDSYENEDVSDHALEQRGLLHAEVKIAGRTVHCFVVHLGLFADSRVRQVQAMTERIRRLVPDDAPVLIAGDFNDWRDELAPLFITQLGVREVFSLAPRTAGDMPRLRDSMRQLGQVLRGQQPLSSLSREKRLHINQLPLDGAQAIRRPPKTFPARFPMLRLDRIYQRGFAVKKAQVLRGKPWTLLSDHAPIVVDVELG